MKTKLIKNIVTYSISQSSARDELFTLLQDLGFKKAEDQSTMTNVSDVADEVIDEVNQLCIDVEMDFVDGDMISIYSIVMLDVKLLNTSKTIKRPRIREQVFHFDSDKNKFL